LVFLELSARKGNHLTLETITGINTSCDCSSHNSQDL
jgi:hypothetical protein